MYPLLPKKYRNTYLKCTEWLRHCQDIMLNSITGIWFSRIHPFFDSGSCSLNQQSPSHPCLAPFSHFVKIKAHNITTSIGKHGHPSLVFTNFIFGCYKLVFHSVNGSAHIAATSFLANLLSLMDGEKASGLLVFSLPTTCFVSIFPSLFLLDCTDGWLRTFCLYIKSYPTGSRS